VNKLIRCESNCGILIKTGWLLISKNILFASVLLMEACLVMSFLFSAFIHPCDTLCHQCSGFGQYYLSHIICNWTTLHVRPSQSVVTD